MTASSEGRPRSRGICDASMWDGFDLPGEPVRHQLPAPLDETFAGEPAALVGNSFGGLISLDLAARRPELVAPTLVAVGEHEKPDFRAIAERLALEIRAAELAVIPGAGHLPSIEQPEATAQLVSSFLTR